MWVLFSGLALMFLAQFASAFNLRTIIARLKLDHHVIWLRMGSPSWWRLSFMRGSDAIQSPGSDRISLWAWLAYKEYLDLNDSVITKLARQQRSMNWLSLTIGILVFGFLSLRHFGVINIS
jgi:hypothetical protein